MRDEHQLRLVGSEQYIKVIEPTTEQVIAEVPDAAPDQLANAVSAVRQVSSNLSAKLLSKRQALVPIISERINATSEEVAKLLSREQIKTLAYGRSEIGAAAAWFSRYFKMELSD